ncbi:MAG TPA: hypothetical protein VHG08_27025 [Longimicrobium sp.]|nr:hypothetical protein [Longimicrobium sp.]
MRKISLDLDTVSVESFETSAGEAAPRGTVAGHEGVLLATAPWQGCTRTCPPTI